MITCFSNYLPNKLHRVKCDQVISGFKDVTLGVPQGTITVPLLIILLISDLLIDLSENALIFCADD